MSRISFRVEDNSREVIRQMENKIKDALREAGLFAEGEAKLRTPVDTGNLRGSISHKMRGDTEVQIGTDVEYALYIEKGTSSQSAQPYLTPAVEENISAIAKILQKHLRQVGGR